MAALLNKVEGKFMGYLGPALCPARPHQAQIKCSSHSTVPRQQPKALAGHQLCNPAVVSFEMSHEQFQ